MALSHARREARRRHIVAAAQALLRDHGGPVFSMAELAARAGVSPATPYNLMGSKAEILRAVVRAEFASFVDKLSPLRVHGPLQALLAATALVVSHYEADRTFYRALYRMIFSADASDIHDAMQGEGRTLWRQLIGAAADSGELSAFARVEPLTDVILRALSAVTLAWLSEGWPHERFDAEMALSIRLILAGVVRDDLRPAILLEVERLLAVTDADRESIPDAGLQPTVR